jgi:hypothetical protein
MSPSEFCAGMFIKSDAKNASFPKEGPPGLFELRFWSQVEVSSPSVSI